MPMRIALIVSVALGLLLAACTTPATAKKPPPAPAYDTRPEVRAFADEMAARHGWDARWVLLQLRGAKLQPMAQRLMMPAPPGQPKNWAAYRDRFVEPQRIAAGAAFWQAHAEALARAEARYGVPAEVIVGIVGVETFYGRVMGRYRALDVLATLAFDFPTGRSDRSAYFRDELEQLLLLARHEDVGPASLTGSFAGAIGLPQFMPGSINRYAVDFDGDGHIDLTASAEDAIGSIAHFLAQHGWRSGMPATFDVTPPDDAAQRAKLLAPDIVPSFDAAAFTAAGAVLSPAGQAHDGLMALVSVDNGGAPPSFVAGTVNFFVLTRYNRSSYYARAVLDLGAAVKAAR
ncbi:lytic murein transglycosylase B [Rubrivivax albus]|uniref:Lytic murein transglycosylase B n=1 Tax=Rubrivivax albus TaxID=2499835 RepID=A0A437JV23_9BURK|nr:lytic murein transglycosylase B [Rubrivivax albus]RVT51073.1 lytic murein transglycosylase B [Rubrivivax albus]